MKQLGHLDNGRILVECSEGEVKAFNALAETAKGHSWNAYLDGYPHMRFDEELEATFGAILAWIQVRDSANELRALATRIDDALKVAPATPAAHKTESA